jgi:acyl-CoA dehydrogenase
MSVLDVFRSTVGAAALGFARRALDEALARVKARQLSARRWPICRWCRGIWPTWRWGRCRGAAGLPRRLDPDMGAARITREAAMAKLYATEAAQRVIDTAVQLHGGDGVRKGFIVESLYREIRALRIYEGASDVQRVVIARQLLGAN